MLNLHCNTCNNDKKKNIKKKKCNYRDSNPGYMDSKSTEASTTLWRPIKNNQYMQKKVINRRVGKMCNAHRIRIRITR